MLDGKNAWDTLKKLILKRKPEELHNQYKFKRFKEKPIEGE
jgi:hypothetical protein